MLKLKEPWQLLWDLLQLPQPGLKFAKPIGFRGRGVRGIATSHLKPEVASFPWGKPLLDAHEKSGNSVDEPTQSVTKGKLTPSPCRLPPPAKGAVA